MTFLPIVERELRVAARRPATFWSRGLVGLVCVGLWAVLSLSAREGMPQGQLGPLLLVAIGIPAFAYCLFSGVFLTADCLSAERREGTLGLLFLTDLKTYDVLLGKLLASSLNGAYGVLAVVPVLALPLLAGGVTGAEFGRVTLVLVATLYLSLAVGMFVSARAKEARHALAATLGAVVGLGGLPPLLWWLPQIVMGLSFDEPTVLLMVPSPAFAFFTAFESIYRSAPAATAYWMGVTCMVGLGTLLLTWAARLLRRRWEGELRPSSTAPARVAEQSAPAGSLFGLRPGPGTSSNPFHWLAERDRRTATMTKWIVLGGALLWLLFFVGIFRRGHKDESFIIAFCIAYGLHVIVKCLVALEASRRLSEDRASGALELLLATPQPAAALARGQWTALKRHFRFARVTLVMINLAFVWMMLGPDPMGIGRHDEGIFATIFIGGAVVVWSDFHSLAWQGMLLGVSGRKHHRAVLAVLGRVLLPPMVLAFLWIFLLIAGRHMREQSVLLCVVSWFAGSIFYDLVLAGRARLRLESGLRELAAQPAGAGGGWWREWLGRKAGG